MFVLTNWVESKLLEPPPPLALTLPGHPGVGRRRRAPGPARAPGTAAARAAAARAAHGAAAGGRWCLGALGMDEWGVGGEGKDGLGVAENQGPQFVATILGSGPSF